MTATTATAAKAVMAVSGTIQKVRTAIAQGGPGVNALCAAVNKCAANKTHRYVLSSVDSVFDGVVLEAAPEGPDAGEPKDVVRTLCKLPRAVYMPRTADVTRPGPDLGALLDKELRKVEETDAPLQEYAAYVQELGETAEFVAEHSIEGFYGPLRPSALRLLNKYKQTLMQQERLGSLRKLTYATQLIHVMKMHSIDSEELADFINAILAKSPNLIKQCSIPTLDVIFKTKLTPEIKEKLDHCLRMTTTTPMGLKEWSELFWMVARNSDNRNTIDCCLQSYKIVARHMNRQDKAAEGNKKAKSVTCSTLMNVVHGVNILQNRLRPSDPVFKSALQVLEAVWPLLEARISKFQSAELIDIAECYFEHHRAVNPQMRHGSRNCLDLLVREFVRRSRELTLRDWVALFEALDRANDAMVVNVLMPKPGNYYVKVAAVQRAWVEDLAQSLRSMPLEELADNVYSLSLPQCSNLCKHLVAAGCYEDPIAATLERRCLTLITDLKYHTTRHVMDFYFVQLQMLLPQQNGLRVVLEGNKPLRDMLGRMSSTNLLRLLSLARCCAPADCRVLLQRLAERVETQTLVLTPQQCASVLKHAARYKDSNLTNAVLAATVPQLLTAAEPHKGFYRMLDLSKFALALPRSDFGDTSPAGLLNELIVQHAPLHVSHLALQHLDLLVQNVTRSGTFPKPLMEAVLSHAMEVDLTGLTSKQLSGMMCSLAELGVRHEPALERLEDALLMAVCDEERDAVAEALIAAASSLAHLGVRTTRLGELFEAIVAQSPVAIASWDYGALALPTRVRLLHAMARFGTVNDNLERAFGAVVRECESRIKESGDAVSFSGFDAEVHRQLYDTYISLLVAGLASTSEAGSLAKSEFLLEHLPAYHWFRHQEALCAEFTASPHYVQLKSTLRQLGLGDAEPRTTEAYFAHVVLDSADCVAKLGTGNRLIYCVPAADELRWWTPRSDGSHDATVNRIESYTHIVGTSARVVDHLQRSGWSVVTVFLREWDTLTTEEREHYLRSAIRVGKTSEETATE